MPVPVPRQRPLDQFEGLQVFFATGRDAGQFQKRGVLPGRIPGGFVECVEGLVVTFQLAQTKAQVVVRFAVVRIWVPSGERQDSSLKIGFRFGKLPVFVVPKPQRVVAAAIFRIPAEGFFVVVVGE